nr:unknown [Zea mays]
MGRRRQPYHNIYTLEGLSLHKLALQLQDHLNPNGFDNASVSSVSDYHNLTSSGCGREPSTTSGPIVPLKRTLQERVVETESCYFCGYGHTTIGNINPDTIIFCNQCERPCHIKCYNNRVVKKKVPLEILKEYMCFHFLCCQECQSLRARLEEGLEKCVGITFLRRIRSNICWRLLSGMDASRDVKLYMPQVIDIFKDAFMDSTDEHSDIISDMVNGKNGDQEKDFRGMYCALLTASTHVVSAAILKVRIEQIAELVLIATRSECRKKGYFILLLKSIEANLRAWNVSLLTAPVDPEMAQIWSEKLGFTILSAEEKESMLESHPLVMFKNLVLVQKSLA